jgi:hypothetical protein
LTEVHVEGKYVKTLTGSNDTNGIKDKADGGHLEKNRMKFYNNNGVSQL